MILSFRSTKKKKHLLYLVKKLKNKYNKIKLNLIKKINF